MTVPDLPQDIIDTIIQTFGKTTASDKEQLKKFCSVSRAFVPQSQRYLFHTVHLLRDGYRDPNPPYHPFGERINVLGRRLYALLQTSPHLLAYVHVLKIHAWSSAELAWMASMGEEVAAIISSCHALQTLEFGSSAPIEWPIMHLSLQFYMISRIQSPQLSTLALVNVKHIPLLLLPAFGSLKGLRLDNVSFSEDEEKPTEYLSEKTSLGRIQSCVQHLSVADSNPSLRILLDNGIISPQMTALELRYGHNGEDTSLVPDLLHVVNKIHELHIALLPNARNALRSIDLSPLQSLRHISILTRPDVLGETYAAVKHMLTTSVIKSANVMLSMVNEDWWDWSCLETIHAWADLSPELPFRQLTLSFIVPQGKDSETVFIDLYSSLNGEFTTKLRSIIGSLGNDERLLSLLITGRVRVAYIFTSYRIIWEDTLNIWQLTVGNPTTGRVPWHIWDPSF
ncbi:hypothetical protein BDN70DRAFT_920301 [Pholiota conissans]|uniref:Uncharacterized protein n=1 Tax=Pholiota conissans TaxID=109636 RepID=A0A9P5Z7G3_9AGAR|nr:hypothetical protein BDN70DRAFT_920301 [Pholiota conissans]